MISVRNRFRELHDEALLKEEQKRQAQAKLASEIDMNFSEIWSALEDLGDEVRSRGLGNIKFANQRCADPFFDLEREYRFEKGSFSVSLKFRFRTDNSRQLNLIFEGTRPLIILADAADELHEFIDGLVGYAFAVFEQKRQA